MDTRIDTMEQKVLDGLKFYSGFTPDFNKKLTFISKLNIYNFVDDVLCYLIIT